jgi:dipeptidyl aminopeptidase/acylaminoacyl peptidase
VRYAQGGGELWVVDAASGEARMLQGARVNAVFTDSLEWSEDGKSLFCALVPGQRPDFAEPERVPLGPSVRVGLGKPVPQRTARDVLTTPAQQRRFLAYASAQLARVPVDGGAPEAIGAAAPLRSWTMAPREGHIVVSRFASPAPLGYPATLFPYEVEIWDRSGRVVARVGEVPLNDRSAISSVASLGPREWRWSRDGGSLWFVSWQDAPGADAMAAVQDTARAQPGTDRVMRWDAPFTGEPAVAATSDMRIRDLSWTPGGKLWITEVYEPRRIQRLRWLDPRDAKRVVTLSTRSTESVYDDPGRPLRRREVHGSVLWATSDDRAVYLAGDGFRSTGQQPFVDRTDLASGRKTRVWESPPTHLEPAVALLDPQAKGFITLRQSNREPPNYWLRRAGRKDGAQLTENPDPAPALTASQRTQFKFMRPDSVRLNAEAVLPADWKPGQALPTIFWVYPNDYRSSAAAQQNRRSPNRFPSQSPLNPEVLVTQGYAVVYPDLAIVGTNDDYVAELRKSAQAAVDECVRRGFCDPARVGVGGHSYGAFSTANLLAHTDLFRAGTASDGAYNRTLTPFTFQAEDRNLWQARETYLDMSPFLHADRINEPLLLLHNQDDTNVGTHPMQSDRMYEALNGMGKKVELVQYPFEDHAPAARETVLDYWARVIEWFDRYVKAAPTSVRTPAGTRTGG